MNYLSPFIDFNEQTYLEANPDVAEGIRKKHHSSAWEHFLNFGYAEHRAGVPIGIQNLVQRLYDSMDTSPVPPAELRLRVHGSSEQSTFEHVGKIVALDIEGAIQQANIPLKQNSVILDFGCGCGRVLRWFHNLHPECVFHSADIDAEAIDWCQANFAALSAFHATQDLPPLPFADEMFDFTYSISVLTHLPEDMQFAWLRELQRVTKKGGYVLLTTYNAAILDQCSRRLKRWARKIGRMLGAKGFYYVRGDKTSGLPDYYRQAYHSERYIRKVWKDFFQIVLIKPQGITNFQDLVLCKRVD